MNAFTADELLRMIPPDTAAEQASALVDENSPDVEPVDDTPRRVQADPFASHQSYRAPRQAHGALIVADGGGVEARTAPAVADQGAPLQRPSPAPTVTRTEASSGGVGGFDFARGLMGFGGGAAGIAAYDKAERDAKEAPLRQMAIEDQTTDRQTKRQELVDAMNPNSESSKAAQQSFAEMNRARAAMLAGKNDRLSKMFEQAATSAAGKSKLQLAGMEKNYAQTMGEFGKMLDSEARRAMAERGLGLREDSVRAQQDNAAATHALRRDQFGETVRHNKATETGKITAKIEQEQEKLNEKVAGLNEQDELMGMVSAQKKKVNTGLFANAFQQGLKKIGLESKEFDTLEGLVSGVNNQIIKLQAGGNVTAGEALRMRQQLPSPDMDDQEFETKLQTVLNQIALKKKNAAKQYQRAAGGQVKDAAPISKELVGKQEGDAAAKARAWLQANPNDPRAPAVREKLETMGGAP
jgi:hypothetical protein